MPLLNPTFQFGLQFATTFGRAKNSSGATTGAGYVLVPDLQLSVAADSAPNRAVTPGWSGSMWYNLVTCPVSATLGSHKALIPHVVLDKIATGVPTGTEVNVQVEGFVQCYVRSCLAAANGNNKRGAALGMPMNTTNTNRFLCNTAQDFVSAATFAGSNNIMTKPAALVYQDLAQATPLAADSAEGAFSASSNGGTQYMGGTVGAAYTGANSSTITLTTGNYICQWCDVLLLGLTGG